MENTIDLLEGSLRIAEHGGSDGQLLEDFFLGVELAHFVVEQRVFLTLANAGRAADDDHGRFSANAPAVVLATFSPPTQ